MSDSPRPPLTRQQQRVLQAVRAQIRASGLPPTQAELARTLGFASLTAAKDHLKALERKGYLQLRGGTARGIRLCEPEPDSALEPAAEGEGLPLIGRVAAGSPLLALEHIEARYRVDPALFRPRADYLLRVRGWSMRDAGLHDGDLLVVHRTPTLQPGQMGVIRVDDEVTVKYWQPEADGVTLRPDNPEFAPIRVDPRRQELAIEGLGVGVIRPWAQALQ